MAVLSLYDKHLTKVQWRDGGTSHCLTSLPLAINPVVDDNEMRLKFEYPTSAKICDALTPDMLVLASEQFYRIEEVTASQDGDGSHKTVEAKHLIYDLEQKGIENLETSETTPGGIPQLEALAQVLQGTDFEVGTVDTDIVLDYLDILQKSAYYALKEQVLKLWGGELVVDNWTISILKQRGQDRGVTLRQYKNIKGFKIEESLKGVYTRVHAKGYKNANFESINGGKDYVDSPYIGAYASIREHYISFDDEDLPEVLLSKTQEFVSKNDKPKLTIDVSLAQAGRANKTFKDLRKIELGDTVRLHHELLQEDLEVRVSKRKFNPVTDENLSITISNDLDNNLFTKLASTFQNSDILKAIATRNGIIRAEKLSGMLNLLTTRIYASAAYTNAEVREDKGILLENTDESSAGYGALYLGPGIFAAANSKTADGSWEWRTIGEGAGLNADAVRVTDAFIDNIAPLLGDKINISANVSIQAISERQDAAELALSPENITQTVRSSAEYAEDMNAISGRIHAAESAIDQTADQISQKVSQNDFNALAGRVDSAESEIIQTANSIDLKVERLQVGGKNMLPNTYNPQQVLPWRLYNAPSGVTLTAEKYSDYPVPHFAIKNIPSGTTEIWLQCQKVLELDQLSLGDNLAAQVQIYPSSLTVRASLARPGVNPFRKTLEKKRNLVSNAAWGVYQGVSEIVHAVTASEYFYLRITGTLPSAIYLREMQLERGTKVTAYRPAVSDIEERVQTAEQKITPDAITSTVRSSQQYQNDLSGKASADAVDALTDRVDSAESAITQTANSIDLKVQSVQIGGKNMLPNTYNPQQVLPWRLYNAPAGVTLTAEEYSDYPVPYFAIKNIPSGTTDLWLECSEVVDIDQLTLGDSLAVQAQVYPSSLTVQGALWKLGGYAFLETMELKKTLASDGAWGVYQGLGEIVQALDGTEKFYLRITGDIPSAIYIREMQLEKGTKVTAYRPAVGDAGVKLRSSHIKIEDDLVEVKSGGKVKIDAGGELNLSGGKVNIAAGDGTNSRIAFGDVFSVGQQENGEYGLSINSKDLNAMRINNFPVISRASLRVQQAQPPSGLGAIWLKPSATTELVYRFTETSPLRNDTLFAGTNNNLKNFSMQPISTDVIADTGSKNLKVEFWLKRYGGTTNRSIGNITVTLLKGSQQETLGTVSGKTFGSWGAHKIEATGTTTGNWLTANTGAITCRISIAGVWNYDASDILAIKKDSVIELNIKGAGSLAAQPCQVFYVP